MSDILLRRSGAILALLIASAASAQVADDRDLDDSPSSAVIQPIREPAGAAELRAAMRRISYNPSDADALADAANASLTLGDANAALNFFTRANSIRPNNGRIVSGLATATVRTENPFEALRLFDDAIRLGVSERSIAVDRALAYDLLGNFSRAQQDYNLARTASTSDDLIIRQAVSLSLAGQKTQSDGMLVPLLQKNNVAAWRARAFMLAERGELRESTKVAQGFLDAASAQRMERYFRLMPDLTAAQKAAAIHLGHFPASQYVGRDSDRVRTVASTIPAVQPAQNASRLIPAGEPLGTKTAAKAAPAKSDRRSDRRRDRKSKELAIASQVAANIPDAIKLPRVDTSRLGTETARATVAEAQTARIASANTNALPPPETARPLVQVIRNAPNATVAASPIAAPSNVIANSGPTITAPAPANVSTQPAPVLAQVPTTNTAVSLLPSDIYARQVPGSGNVPVAQVTHVPTSVSPPSENTVAAPQSLSNVSLGSDPIKSAAPPMAVTATSFDLGAIVSSIQIPESEQKPSAVPVDLKAIKPVVPKPVVTADKTKVAKLDPKLVAKAKIEAENPARYWVQVATGQESALGFDYRRFAKKSPELFKKQNGWTSDWGRTSRLLVGPFPDLKTAKKWEADYKKAGGDGFMWQSEKGLVVAPLKSK